jgi:hypothetical protein
MYRQAQRENYTIRQLYQAVALGRGHRVVVGTAADIVDQMESWQAAQAADGYKIIPSHLPSGLDDVVDLVVPELQRRGLFRRAYQGTHCARISAWHRKRAGKRPEAAIHHIGARVSGCRWNQTRSLPQKPSSG